MSNIKINHEKCKGCTLCIGVCPKNSLKISADFNKAGYHPAIFVEEKGCTACGFCFQVCPDVCIEVYKENK